MRSMDISNIVYISGMEWDKINQVRSILLDIWTAVHGYFPPYWKIGWYDYSEGVRFGIRGYCIVIPRHLWRRNTILLVLSRYGSWDTMSVVMIFMWGIFYLIWDYHTLFRPYLDGPTCLYSLYNPYTLTPNPLSDYCAYIFQYASFYWCFWWWHHIPHCYGYLDLFWSSVGFRYHKYRDGYWWTYSDSTIGPSCNV